MAYAFTLDASKYLERTSDLPDYNGNYTIACWIKFNQLTTFDSMFVLTDGTANNRDMLLLNNTTGNNLTSRVTVAAALTTQAGSTTLSTATWYHVAMVRDAAASLKAYLNGNLEGTNTRSVSGRAAISNMRIALEQGGGNAIDASFAHLKMWTRALTAQELLSESKNILVNNLTSVYGWWPTLINAQRNKDYSGKGRNWTEVGTIGDVANPPVGWGASNPRPIYIPAAAGVNIPVMMHQRMVQGMS